MKLTIRKIEDAGKMDGERVVLRATEDGDIGAYAMFRGEAVDSDKVASGSISNTFWFPDQAVKKGDFVVLYSKSGKISEKLGAQGTTSYFFYWMLKSPIWDSKHRPVLVNVADWEALDEPREATSE